jgi:hypothetical protein
MEMKKWNLHGVVQIFKSVSTIDFDLHPDFLIWMKKECLLIIETDQNRLKEITFFLDWHQILLNT